MLHLLHGNDIFKNVIPMLHGNDIFVIFGLPVKDVCKKIAQVGGLTASCLHVIFQFSYKFQMNFDHFFFLRNMAYIKYQEFYCFMCNN